MFYVSFNCTIVESSDPEYFYEMHLCMSNMLCFYLAFQRCPSQTQKRLTVYDLQKFFLRSTVFLHFITTNNNSFKVMCEISVLLKLRICQERSHEFVELSECM